MGSEKERIFNLWVEIKGAGQSRSETVGILNGSISGFFYCFPARPILHIIQNLERQVLTILPDKKNVDILTNRAGQRDPDNTLKSIGYRKFYRFLWLVEMVYG